MPDSFSCTQGTRCKHTHRVRESATLGEGVSSTGRQGLHSARWGLCTQAHSLCTSCLVLAGLAAVLSQTCSGVAWIG